METDLSDLGYASVVQAAPATNLRVAPPPAGHEPSDGLLEEAERELDAELETHRVGAAARFSADGTGGDYR